MIKNPRLARRLILRRIIEGYLLTSSPMRHHQTTAQIRAAAKQMEQSNRIPVAVARALMEAATNAKALENAVSLESTAAVGA